MATVPAVLGTARLGNFRLGYQPSALATVRATRVRITIGGLSVTARVQRHDLTIRNILNDDPDTCTLTIRGTAPTVDQVIRITLDSNTPRLLFNGTIQTVNLRYEGKPTQLAYDVTAIDDTARANARLPFGSWTEISATTVAQALVATFAPGFTAAHVELGLPLVSVNLDGTEGMNGAMRQLAKLIGGYFYWEDFDLHLFQTEATDTPATITGGPGQLLDTPPIQLLRETSQIRTRNYGKGHGDPVAHDVVAGATVIPVASKAFFSTSGGQAISETQIVSYTGLGWQADVSPAAWTVQGVSNTFRSWTDLTWADGLGLFVGVANTGAVITSPDGVHWTDQIGAPDVLTAIAWSPSLGLLVAVGSSANPAWQVVTSPDGITWTLRTAAANLAWKDVAWAPALNLFAAVAQNAGTTSVMTSPNGITWTNRTSVAGAWFGVTWAPALGLFVAVGSLTATYRVMTSADGITWTGRTASANLEAVTWSPALGLLVAVGDAGAILTSSDGITWTARTSPLSSSWNSVAWAPEIGLFLVVATYTSGTGFTAIVSDDGINWIPVVVPAAVLRTIAWAPPLGQFAVMGGSGTILLNQSDPTLTGVTGLLRPLAKDVLLHLWIQRDDLAAQAALAASGSTPEHPYDGIIEHLIVDERRGLDSLTALCDADLERFSVPLKTVTYATRDVLTKAGKPITFALASPLIAETLTIQEVVISEIDVSPGLAPRFTTTASSVRFSLEDLLRRMNALLVQ